MPPGFACAEGSIQGHLLRRVLLDAQHLSESMQAEFDPQRWVRQTLATSSVSPSGRSPCSRRLPASRSSATCAAAPRPGGVLRSMAASRPPTKHASGARRPVDHLSRGFGQRSRANSNVPRRPAELAGRVLRAREPATISCRRFTQAHGPPLAAVSPGRLHPWSPGSGRVQPGSTDRRLSLSGPLRDTNWRQEPARGPRVASLRSGIELLQRPSPVRGPALDVAGPGGHSVVHVPRRRP